MKTPAYKNDILNAFRHAHTLSAKDLCILLPHIDRATIYRNLESLVSSEELRELNFNKDHTLYELNSTHNHQHFLCKSCNRVSELVIDFKHIISSLPKNIQAKDADITVKGFCENCIKKI